VTTKRKTKKPTANERIAALEAKLALVMKQEDERWAALNKLLTSWSETDQKRSEALQKWSGDVTNDIHRLFDNQNLLGAALNVHTHPVVLPAALLLLAR
jgi:hypothetical protein